MADQVQKQQKLNINEYMNHQEKLHWEEHMFSDTGFKMGEDKEAGLIVEHGVLYEERSAQAQIQGAYKAAV